jgi:hypothetical protein
MSLALKPTPNAAASPTTGASPTSTGAHPFAERADDASIERTADALRAKGYAVHVVEDAAAAKATILDLLPDGAEVGQGASQTLEDTGVTEAIEQSGRYDAVRLKTRSMDRSTPEGLRAMRKAGVGPDWFVNSAHAVTEDGTIVVASNTGSQLAPLSFGAGEVILAIGSQKIVPDLDAAFRRIEEHILPLESARMQGIYGIDSEIKKVMIIYKEFRPGRFTIVLIKEPVGF